MRFEDRYASAVRSSNLKSEPKTTFSDADVLGAAGKAANRHPLALALLRLFTGDNHASAVIIELLTDRLVGKAFRMGDEVDRAAASLMARIALDWFRDAVCKRCGGHGFKLLKGSPHLGEDRCPHCEGTGKRDFEGLFSERRVDLARWVLVELEREIALAGPAAIEMLAPRLVT